MAKIWAPVQGCPSSPSFPSRSHPNWRGPGPPQVTSCRFAKGAKFNDDFSRKSVCKISAPHGWTSFLCSLRILTRMARSFSTANGLLFLMLLALLEPSGSGLTLLRGSSCGSYLGVAQHVPGEFGSKGRGATCQLMPTQTPGATLSPLFRVSALVLKRSQRNGLLVRAVRWLWRRFCEVLHAMDHFEELTGYLSRALALTFRVHLCNNCDVLPSELPRCRFKDTNMRRSSTEMPTAARHDEPSSSVSSAHGVRRVSFHGQHGLTTLLVRHFHLRRPSILAIVCPAPVQLCSKQTSQSTPYIFVN